MKVVSNGQFWAYTIVLFIFWIIVLTSALNDEYKIKQKNSLSQTNAETELKYSETCNNLCKLCNCLAFYCGEECICECNDDHTDTECIRKTQKSAHSLNIPFQVLIQGPKDNKFLQNALAYEQNQERKLYGYRHKRPTIVVYKPRKASLDMQKYNIEKKTAIQDMFKVADSLKKRLKRSTRNKHFEWFNNLGNNLLRPAPLGGCKRLVEHSKKATIKATTSSPVFDNSWIFNSFDNTRDILTPRPLKKWRTPQSIENNEDSNVKNEAVSSSTNNKFKDDNPENGIIDFNYSRESKNTVSSNKEPYLSDKAKLDKSQENLIDSLYRRLFKNNLDNMSDKYSLALDETAQEAPQDSALYQDELSTIVNDNVDLFLEEADGENCDKKTTQQSKTNDLSTSQKLLPIKVKNGLQELRLPWFKPGKLLQKFRQVINS